MTATQSLKLVVGMIILTAIEACLKAVWPAFPFAEAAGFQWGGLGGIMTTKIVNDVAEMKNGITAAKMAAQAAPCAPTPAP